MMSIHHFFYWCFMTSIHTNAGAIAALQTLRSIGSDMQQVEAQVSSGLRIRLASDDAAYWAIAITMRSDTKAISAVQDALGLGAAKVDVAYAGTEAIVDLLRQFKARLVAAKEEGVDSSKVQGELKQLNAQAERVVASSSFNGINWLQTSAATHLTRTSDLSSWVVSSFVRSQDGVVAVNTTNVDLTLTSMLNSGGGGILQKGFVDVNNTRPDPEYAPEFDLAEIDVTASSFTVDDYITGVEHMLKGAISSASMLGALQARIDIQNEFASRLSNAIDRGIGRLVDADMNEASTRLKALQTQEKLGLQALSIANANAENILQLFGR